MKKIIAFIIVAVITCNIFADDDIDYSKYNAYRRVTKVEDGHKYLIVAYWDGKPRSMDVFETDTVHTISPRTLVEYGEYMLKKKDRNIEFLFNANGSYFTIQDCTEAQRYYCSIENKESFMVRQDPDEVSPYWKITENTEDSTFVIQHEEGRIIFLKDYAFKCLKEQKEGSKYPYLYEYDEAATAALTGDSIKQDSVKQDSIKQDSIKQDSIKQDSIKQDSIIQKQDTLSVDTPVIDIPSVIIDDTLANDSAARAELIKLDSITKYVKYNIDSLNRLRSKINARLRVEEEYLDSLLRTITARIDSLNGENEKLDSLKMIFEEMHNDAVNSYLINIDSISKQRLEEKRQEALTDVDEVEGADKNGLQVKRYNIMGQEVPKDSKGLVISRKRKYFIPE